MFLKKFLSANICLILLTIQKIQSFLMRLIKNLLNLEFGGDIADEFVGLKSQIYSINKIDGKECNITKGVNIATEFNKLKDVLFYKKIIRHKMKRIQAKKHKIGTYEIDKISLLCFDDKRFVLDDEMNMLTYFHKDSVTSCIKKFKKIVIKKKRVKKVVIKKKRLKKIVIIEEDYDNRKKLRQKKSHSHR